VTVVDGWNRTVISIKNRFRGAKRRGKREKEIPVNCTCQEEKKCEDFILLFLETDEGIKLTCHSVPLGKRRTFQ